MYFTKLKSNHFLLTQLCLLVVVGRVAFDLYLPALPLIQQQLQGSRQHIQLTISLFSFGFGISQLFYGPWSDRFGRRRALFIGMLLFLIGCMASCWARTLTQLIWARLVMGLGVSSGVVTARAMARDLFVGAQLTMVSALQTLVLALSLFMAPMMGGCLLRWFSWRSNFLALWLFAIACLIFFYYRLPETNQSQAKRGVFSHSLSAYSQLLTDSAFMGHALTVSFAFSGLVIYFQLSPFIFQQQFHWSPLAYSALSLLVATVFLLGTWAVRRALKKDTIERIIVRACLVLILAGLMMSVAYCFHYFSMYLVIASSMVYVYGLRLIMPTATSACLSPFGAIAGSCAALLGALIMLVSSAVSYLCTLWHFNSVLLLGIVYLVLGLLSWCCSGSLSRQVIMRPRQGC